MLTSLRRGIFRAVNDAREGSHGNWVRRREFVVRLDGAAAAWLVAVRTSSCRAFDLVASSTAAVDRSQTGPYGIGQSAEVSAGVRRR